MRGYLRFIVIILILKPHEISIWRESTRLEFIHQVVVEGAQCSFPRGIPLRRGI